MRVLLFSNDLMPFEGLPTSGGGLRAYQLMRGLEAHGIEVLGSMPGFTYLAEKYRNEIKPEQRELFWRGDTQVDLIERHKPDAIIYSSNWDHCALTKKPDVPLILDLHGSRLIENALWNLPLDRDRKARTLGMADCIICAGKMQRNYFNGWLVQAGRFPKDEQLIRYIPISLSPDQPLRNDDTSEFPMIVSGGGWFPWQNQSRAIFAISSSIERYQRGTLNIFGTPHQTNSVSITPAEQKIRDIYAQVCSIAERSKRVRVNGYISRDELVKIYASAHVAVELMEYNLERELAFTTRTVEYMWSGLPVLYNDYSELSSHIREYDAGWAVSPDDSVTLALALDEMFNDHKLLKQKSENAKRLVADRFTWDKTIQPLVDFLRRPISSTPVYPVTHSSYSMPSFLFPRGAVAGAVVQTGEIVSQRFIVPAVNLSALSVPFLSNDGQRPFSVEISVADERGRTIARRKMNSVTLGEEPAFMLKFNPFNRPRGGQECVASVRLLESTETSPEVRLFALKNAKYPFVCREGEDALCLNFIHGGGVLQKFKDFIKRAFH